MAVSVLASRAWDREEPSHGISWWSSPTCQNELIAEAVKRRLPGAELTPIGGTLLNMLGGTVVSFAKTTKLPS